jgi:His-Xaa-Ser system radical SAM maturase HxsC
MEDRSNLILLTHRVKNGCDYLGYVGVLAEKGDCEADPSTKLPPILYASSAVSILDSDDVVAMDPSGLVRILYRRKSRHNILFLTARCNSSCIVCPQPPRNSDDALLLKEAMRIVDLADPATGEFCITGGEPTLLGCDLFDFISYCRRRLPHTCLNLLTNGRRFEDKAFAKGLAEVRHPNLIVGIPLYSDIDYEHDYVVQSRRGFEQSVFGILNLALYHVPIELRVVVLRLNYNNLVRLAEFIYRNLPFANHVAFMALEPVGFAAQNIDELWIDPMEYGAQLSLATHYLAARGIRVSIYNHQLCVVPADVRQDCRQSIADWKSVHMPCCQDCVCKSACGGFFESALTQYHSAYITPITSKEGYAFGHHGEACRRR